MTEVMNIALKVGELLEACGIRYVVGGSLASALCGEPRSTLDADFVVALSEGNLKGLLEGLEAEFYIDGDELRRAVRNGSHANAIHSTTSVKVDFFVAASRLQRQHLSRRQRVVVAMEPERALYFYAPEDILVQKLVWYRAGGEISDRQWRDVAGIAEAQGNKLDWEYIRTQAEENRIGDLLGRISRDR
ncbi:MAG TPA: hypothetical protein VIC32_10190 [Terriglobales bacterium]|jgi:hypothetical protein